MRAEQQAALKEAWQGLKTGQLQSAGSQCRALLEQWPEFAPGLDVASRVAMAMGQRRPALDLARRAVDLDGDHFAYLSQLALSLLGVRDTVEALEIIEKLAARPRSLPAEHDALGNLFSQVGDQDQALDCFRDAADADPESAHHQMNLALCLQATGQIEEAEDIFDRCIELGPEQAEAWLHRSRLRKQRPQSNHVPQLESQLAKPGANWRGQMSLHYALAKELEDLGQYSDSFAHLQRGAGLRRAHMKHDAEADRQAMQLVMENFSQDYLDLSGSGHDSPEPIFIVGLPRTGTTLVERILGSHSEVFAAGELNNFAEVLTELVKQKQPRDRFDFIRLAASVDAETLGRNYVESTRPLTGQTARFIDKLPLNFLYCGLIHRALPRARIVHLRRHPMDTCFAIYKTLFKQAYPFSYDLQELGHYYLGYHKLMEHWQAVMPGQILDLEYEALISDQEGQTRRLLDFCGLPWEDACMEFHRSTAPSMTASLAQVRQPLYASSIGRWQCYREELAELESMLRAEGLHFQG